MDPWYLAPFPGGPTGDLRDIFLQGAMAPREIEPAVEAEPAVIPDDYDGDDDSGDDAEKDIPDPPAGNQDEDAPAADDPLDGSGGRVKRVWTKEEEIAILRGFLEFKKKKRNVRGDAQHSSETFYEQIQKQLNADFTSIQLKEKLRRFKKKYRRIVNNWAPAKTLVFKDNLEKTRFEMSRRIWGSDPNPVVNVVDDKLPRHTATSIPPVVRSVPDTEPKCFGSTGSRLLIFKEEKPSSSNSTLTTTEMIVRRCVLDVFQELAQLAMSGKLVGGFASGIDLGIFAVNMKSLLSATGSKREILPEDENWKKQRIMELELFLQRVELVLIQLRSTLEELKSKNPPPPPPGN